MDPPAAAFFRNNKPEGFSGDAGAAVKAFYDALRPSPFVRELVEAATPARPFGAVHARLEDDTKRWPEFWQARVPLKTLYDSMRAGVTAECRGEAATLYLCRADIPQAGRGDAAATTWILLPRGYSTDGSRRRRGRGCGYWVETSRGDATAAVDIPWRRVAAAPRPRLWIFRGDEVVATPRLRFRGDERLPQGTSRWTEPECRTRRTEHC